MNYIIKTSRIKVRQVEIEDAIYFTNWWNDGKLMESVGFKNGLNISLDKVKERLLKSIESNNTKIFIVIDSINNKPIGELSYGQLDNEDKSCRIGMKICDLSYQGKHYGLESLCEFNKYLFDTFSLDKIFIDTLLANTKAINLYKKIGSKTIEIVESFWTNPEGISCDAIFFQLDKNDFYDFLGIFSNYQNIYPQ